MNTQSTEKIRDLRWNILIEQMEKQCITPEELAEMLKFYKRLKLFINRDIFGKKYLK